ncbi:hypothetical protein HHI36_021400 [Cryptolaemus montrouzieri]|uniref:Uncharacterized protein n=1 Tax=Cryptolaemus montrouzieri TaxID=559131 RepID=A0ABD2MWM7_9CUCU
MFKYLASFFWGSDDTLTLDEAFKILENETEVHKQNEAPLQLESYFDNEYSAVGKVGFITGIEDGTLIIDKVYKFKSDSPYFNKGSKVSYDIVLSNKDQNVSNVTIIENDWDVVEERISTWCLRTIVCKVDERKGRKLLLNPGEIRVDLDEVASEFVPIIGDWIQLDAKCELDEEIVDLNGKILEILKLSPLRPQIKLCTVSIWDLENNEGILDNAIYFNKESLSGGYAPLKTTKWLLKLLKATKGDVPREH